MAATCEHTVYAFQVAVEFVKHGTPTSVTLDVRASDTIGSVEHELSNAGRVTRALGVLQLEGKKVGQTYALQGQWAIVGKKYQRFNDSSGVNWERLLFKVREVPRRILAEGKKSRHDTGPAVDYTRDKCSICLADVVDGEDQTLLPCGHFFHNGCIKAWKTGPEVTCPNCRAVSRWRPDDV